MALIRCPECGAQISSMAKQCIKCGFPLHMLNEVKTEEKKQNNAEPVISIELVEPEPVRIEPAVESVRMESETNTFKGIIQLSENAKIAKQAWNLEIGEIMAVRACEVIIEGISAIGFKNALNPMRSVWYLYMTNRRFIVSKQSSMKAQAMSGQVWKLVPKGVPIYVIPFENISSVNMENNVLTIQTKDGDRQVHTILSRGDARKINEQIDNLLR